MYTKAAVWATSATPLPMWDVDSSGMVHLPNVVTVFRDSRRPMSELSKQLAKDVATSTHINTSSTEVLAAPRQNSIVLNLLIERKFQPKYFDWLGFIVSITRSIVVKSSIR